MKCSNCDNNIYNVYSALNSKYTKLHGFAYCPKCDLIYTVILKIQKEKKQQ